jgi:hypothetical protein
MIFRPSRERRGDDRLLELKALLFVVGASVGVAGMISGRAWLVWIAIAVVAAGVAVRLIGERKGRGD